MYDTSVFDHRFEPVEEMPIVNNRIRDFGLPRIDPVTGLRLRGGNGCPVCNNCFECLGTKDCTWNFWQKEEYQ